MKKLINFSIQNKLALWLFTAIIVAAGLYSGFTMKMETIPNINIPIVSVTTVYPGASPEQVDDAVSTPLAKQLEQLSGVKAVHTTSMANVSSLVIEYDFKQDLTASIASIKETIDSLSFPDGVEKTKVSKISIDALPIFTMTASDDTRSLLALSELVEDTIVPTIEQVEGVASVSVAGQQTQVVELTIDEKALQAVGLTTDQLTQLIQSQDLAFPLGLYPIGKEDVSVVVDGSLATLKDLQTMRVPNAVNPDLRLQDVATFNVKTVADSVSRTNGEPSISLSIVKTAEANTVDVVREVEEAIDDIESSYAGVRITPIFDQAKPIVDAVTTMLEKALIGGLFAVLIILLFLRDVKTTIISIVSIPLSLLMAILCLKQFDITLNIMTLGAMTVAIGRVIDDSIVVIENIYRRMRLQDDELTGKALIVDATKEMFVPIFASTIVTVAVFLPLGLVQGTVGELFLPFALTMVFSLMASLLVAVTIVPMMAHWLFKEGVGVTPHSSKPQKTTTLATRYKHILSWALDHKAMTSLAAIALLGLSFTLIPAIGFSFLASDEEKVLMVIYEPAPGVQQEATETLAEQVEQYFLAKEDVTLVSYSVGGENALSPIPSNDISFYITYDNDIEDFAKEKETVTNDLTALNAEGEWTYQDTSGGASSNELQLSVSGKDRAEVEPIVASIMDLMKKDANFESIDTNLTNAYKEYRLVVQPKALQQYGVTTAQIGFALASQGKAPVLTTVEQDGKELSVYVRVPNASYRSLDQLMNQSISTATGTPVSVSTLTKVQEGTTSNAITKTDSVFNATITARFTTDDIGAASKDLQEKIDDLTLPPNVDVEFGGVTEQMKEAFVQLGLAIVAAIAIVYLVLVITFGGGLAPFAILFSLPFTIIGALLALFIAGETISVTSFIGLLMLVGIVVTNAIVLVHRIIHKEEEGLGTRDAILEAGATRLRPILMTALATVGALAPLAVGVGGSGLISKGLGVTVIGGLISSTLLTLLIVPIVYETLMNMKHKTKQAKTSKHHTLFDQVVATSLMIPRTDIVALNITDAMVSHFARMKKEGATHYLVMQEQKDTLVGYVKTNELFARLAEGQAFTLVEHLHPVLFAPEDTAVDSLLRLMQESNTPFIVLQDPFGGTTGVVTMEAILAYIVQETK